MAFVGNVDKYHSSVQQKYTKQEFDKKIEDILQKSCYGHLAQHAVTQHNVKKTPGQERLLEMEKKQIFDMARANDQLPIKTHFTIPNLTSQLEIFTYPGETIHPSSLNLTGFNEVHPLRDTLPVRGPGINNYSMLPDESSYLRVAGVLAIKSKEFYELILPRYIPTMLDLIISALATHDRLSASVNVNELMKQKFLIIDIILQAIRDITVPIQIKPSASDLTALNLLIKERCGDHFHYIRDSVAVSAQAQLDGDGGYVLQASQMLYNYMKTKSHQLQQELVTIYTDLAEFISAETLSYAKARDVLDYQSLKKKTDVDEITINVTSKREDLVEHIQVMEAIPRSISTVPQLNELIKQDHGLRVVIRDINYQNIEIQGDISQNYDYYLLREQPRFALRRLDRSNITRSSITFAPKTLDGNIVRYLPKLNGFQYNITYQHNNNEIQITARYPQAPILMLRVRSQISFSINIEIAAAKDGSSIVRLISVHYIGAANITSPDHLDVISALEHHFHINVKNNAGLTYSQHDGVVFSTPTSTYYVKPEIELDSFYDHDAKTFGRFVYTNRNKVREIRTNHHATIIFLKHLEKKDEKYKQQIISNAKKQHDAFFATQNGPNRTVVTQTAWWALAPPEIRVLLSTAGRDFPGTLGYYNIPIAYSNQPDIPTVTQVGHLDLDALYNFLEHALPTTATQLDNFTKTSTSYQYAALTHDFMN